MAEALAALLVVSIIRLSPTCDELVRAEAVVAGCEGARGVLAVVGKVSHGGLILLADGGPDGGPDGGLDGGWRPYAVIEAARGRWPSNSPPPPPATRCWTGRAAPRSGRTTSKKKSRFFFTVRLVNRFRRSLEV